MRTLLVFFITILLFLYGTQQATAQTCPAMKVQSCQAVAPTGALLHGPNSRGTILWTAQCGPDTIRQDLDKLCDEVARCPGAGGFGAFLQAVSGFCREKHFEGYFGLDGMTFGILDWTEDNLPTLLSALVKRSPGVFEQSMGGVILPMKSSCLDPNWACEANRQGRLMCDTKFRAGFTAALGSEAFKKAQIDVAMASYRERLDRYASLGLKTEYGNVAMIVIANNLKSGETCKPSTWKAACTAHTDEIKMVDCMLDEYVSHQCRGGNPDGALKRAETIRKVFKDRAPGITVRPTTDAVLACSTNWGKSVSGTHP